VIEDARKRELASMGEISEDGIADDDPSVDLSLMIAKCFIGYFGLIQKIR